MALTLAINCVMFLLGQMIVLTAAELNPNVLETTIITENNEAIALSWVETEQFLANEHLPIWTTTFSRHHLIKENDIMKEIGTFKTYYDLEKSSAIVLIKNWNCIYGVIDVRYTLVCLPLDKLSGHQHKIGESEYIFPHGDPDFPNHDKILDLSKTSTISPSANTWHDSSDEFKMLIKTFVNPDNLPEHNFPNCKNPEHDRTEKRPSTSLKGPPPNKRPRMDFHYKEEVITVYPEILIFISHEIVDTTKHLSTLILRYIVHLNAVAMLFAKLKTHNIKIHINIAGIVIDKNGLGFPPEKLFVTHRHPEGKAVLDSLGNYIQRATNTIDFRRLLWPADSFDMFLYSTTHQWQERETNPGGISTDIFDMRAQHKLQRKLPNTNKKYLGSMIDFTNLKQHYVNAAREIAHLMTVEDDPPNLDLSFNGAQCYGIMQRGSQHCLNCLTWSHASIESFKKYLTTNMNRCYLRNLPRSLYTYGIPRKSLIPADQCLCFGYSPNLEALTHLHNRGLVKNQSCQRMIRCNSPADGSVIRNVVYPIDGTPCDEYDDNKVCWNTKCTTTQISVYGQYAEVIHNTLKALKI